METEYPFDDLKSNPIFQLSLSSKELFHSNFLYWMATNDSTLDLFKNILENVFGATEWAESFNLSDYAVCREKMHFDFSIWEIIKSKTSEQEDCEPQNENGDDSTSQEGGKVDTACSDPSAKLGKVVFVLENKFKSIPYKKQLDEYAAEVLYINDRKGYNEIWHIIHSGKGIKVKTSKEAKLEVFNYWLTHRDKAKLSCEFVLLSLATDFLDKVEIGDRQKLWKIVDYISYCDKFPKENSQSDFAVQILKNYADAFRCLAENINSDLSNKLDDTEDFQKAISDNYVELRLNDVWQKLVMHKMAQDIVPDNNVDFEGSYKHILEDIASCKKEKLYLTVEFYHSQGLLALKKIINDFCVFEIQIQGGKLSVGIGILSGYRDKIFEPKKPKKTEKLSYGLEQWKKGVGDFISPCIDLASNKNLQCEDKVYAYYNNDNSGYFYRSIKTGGKIIDIKNAIKELLSIDTSNINITIVKVQSLAHGH